MATRRKSILEVLVGRLEAIRTSSGFDTDAGAKVYFGEVPALGESDPDQAIALVPGVEEPQWQVDGHAMRVRLPVHVAAIAKADLAEPHAAIESLIGDIKRAIELEDRTLGGLISFPMERGVVQAMPRESGSTTVGATLTYLVAWKEGWGNPS